ncbi:alpha/beta hydrolase [Lentzea sp.]|uniref:alpha/beta fold hydrolase n=1 Tax=Lentzea sp. TaxID=56099 RepID=UPI002C22930A|nr:alpha/beta hydrolase [Lentzea sp.]HUQ58071.1 alpha/beta hydrolase [Lentzea sp.]
MTTLHTSTEARPGLTVTTRQAGQGNPVVLLHGAAGPDSTTTLLGHLAAGHRVVAPTHPGWDGTDRPEELDSVADLAAAYLDLLARQELDEVTVIGVSFGGWVAAEMAASGRARRIGRLVLIDSIGPRLPGHEPTMPSGPPSAVDGAARQGPPPGNMAAFRAYSGAALSDPTLLDRVRGLQIPALLVWGENDTVVTPEFGRLYAEAFPRGRFVLIPGGGHLPMREAPEATFAAIDEFLAATAVSASAPNSPQQHQNGSHP